MNKMLLLCGCLAVLTSSCAKSEPEEPTPPKVIELQYADIDEIYKHLQTMKSDEGRIIKNTRMILITNDISDYSY